MSRATLLVHGMLREPTFHFVLLAGVLFLASAVLNAGDSRTIEIDRAEIEARISQIEATGVVLAADERQQVLEAYVDEQVLVREALAMGLEDDARIHDFLAQKMLHVLSADVIQPTESELEAYYAANHARYATEPTATADEVVFATPDTLPAALRRQLGDGASPEQLVTDVPMRRSALSDVTLDGLAGIFGADVARAIFRADAGEWVGPHRSVRGQHWLRLRSRTEEASPPLDAVRAQVRLDWIVEQEAARLERRVRELRDGYDVVLVGEEGRW